MNTEDPSNNPGRMMLHRVGAGPVTEEKIAERAREIARIEHSREVTDQHREQASRELHGRTLPDTIEDDAFAEEGASRDPAEPLPERGHHTLNREGDNEESLPERLALEGVDEAQHEQMLADRRRRTDTP
jgi:hypothetical protein